MDNEPTWIVKAEGEALTVPQYEYLCNQLGYPEVRAMQMSKAAAYRAIKRHKRAQDAIDVAEFERRYGSVDDYGRSQG